MVNPQDHDPHIACFPARRRLCCEDQKGCEVSTRSGSRTQHYFTFPSELSIRTPAGSRRGGFACLRPADPKERRERAADLQLEPALLRQRMKRHAFDQFTQLGANRLTQINPTV